MSQISNQSWNVGKVGATCAACGCTMEPGKACWAALVEVKRTPSDASAPTPPDAKTHPAKTDANAPAGLPYQRLDFCEPCWDAGQRPDARAPQAIPGDMISFWKTAVPTPTAKKKLLVDDSVLMDIFMRLEEAASAAVAGGAAGTSREVRFRYVLALLLMRKRLLKYEGMEERKETESPEIWLMIPRGTDQPVRVLNPQLTAEQIVEVSGELSGILAEEV